MIISAIAIYLVFLLLVRILGARVLSGLTGFDSVVGVVLGAVAGRVVIGHPPTLAAGVIGLVTLLCCGAAFGLIRNNIRLHGAINVQPTVVLAHGRPQPDLMRKTHITHDEITSCARRAGISNLRQVRCIVHEPSGALSVVDYHDTLDPDILHDVLGADRVLAGEIVEPQEYYEENDDAAAHQTSKALYTMSSSFHERSFDSYDVRERSSFAPFVRGRSSGIYIFEFENGQRYVGQTVNFIGRFNAHIRDSDHHEAWEDITRLMIMDAKQEDLNELEFQIIAWQKEEGYSLRNKVFNFGFEGPSQLDSDIPIIDQLHWANGDSDYDIADIHRAADRPLDGRTKLHQSPEGKLPWMDKSAPEESWPTVANAVCADVGAVIARAIPEAVELESIYWTVSDYPNTVGGRLATLNVGSAEVLYIPRAPRELIRGDGTRVTIHISSLNMAAGTVITDGEVQTRWDNAAPLIPTFTRQPQYGTGPVDNVGIPTGLVGQALDHPEILQGVRELCLNLMRSGQSGIFRRWHARELTRRAYEEHIRVTQQNDYRL